MEVSAVCESLSSRRRTSEACNEAECHGREPVDIYLLSKDENATLRGIIEIVDVMSRGFIGTIMLGNNI